jgi:hypothetical protein
MSCSPFDLRDFLLRELTEPQQRQVEDHVEACSSCRQELDRLHVTQTALFSLADEEIPQRIAFVSDKVFEPSPLRRAWASFWGSGARLVFASAAMLSVALVVSPMIRPAPIASQPQTPTSTVSDSEIRQRIEAGVTRAVADIETNYRTRTEQLVKDLETRDVAERRLLAASYEDTIDRANHTIANLKLSGYNAGEPQ